MNIDYTANKYKNIYTIMAYPNEKSNKNVWEISLNKIINKEYNNNIYFKIESDVNQINFYTCIYENDDRIFEYINDHVTKNGMIFDNEKLKSNHSLNEILFVLCRRDNSEIFEKLLKVKYSFIDEKTKNKDLLTLIECCIENNNKNILNSLFENINDIRFFKKYFGQIYETCINNKNYESLETIIDIIESKTFFEKKYYSFWKNIFIKSVNDISEDTWNILFKYFKPKKHMYYLLYNRSDIDEKKLILSKIYDGNVFLGSKYLNKFIICLLENCQISLYNKNENLLFYYESAS